MQRSVPALGAGSLSAIASLAIIAFIVGCAAFDLLVGIPPEKQWIPFATCLVGVTLYVVSSVKKRRERFDYAYLPDYFYRAAQAVVYLYATLAVMQLDTTPGALSNWPPNLVGLFVGLYIPHVEKAIEGFGQRFEEALTAVFGRSLAAPTSREKDIQYVQLEGRVRDIQRAAEILASQRGGDAVVDGLRTRLDAVSKTMADGDYDAVRKEVNDLVVDFEATKEAMRQEEATVQKVLALAATPTDPGPAPPSGGKRKRTNGSGSATT